MNPILLAVAGPLQETIFPLADEVYIGRDFSNQICLADMSVSRRHCFINNAEGRFKISDLGSRNGTIVNGLPVKEQILEPGSRVQIGEFRFLFLMEEKEAARLSTQVQIDDRTLVPRSSLQLNKGDTLYFQPEVILATLPPTARTARDLSALLNISKVISAIRKQDELQQKLLELVLEVIPAERAAILFVEESHREFKLVFGIDKVSGPDQPVRVSRTVAQQVIREATAILGNDILETTDYGKAESLVASQIHSLLCVPMAILDRVIGVIYLDTSNRSVRFDSDDLQLLAAIASMAGFSLENLRDLERLESENRRLQAEVEIQHSMVGESPRMREVYQFIAKVAPSDSTILICGESGTGKELVARAIHLNSHRAARPFVGINCAALTETLLESELFGHEKGAFTGAIAQKKGKLEVAEGGTLFLDEVGELASTVQAKLLRVLQEREFERVGGTRPIKANIRIIAATNMDLLEAVRARMFRQDLYYRLNVVSLAMPPLRERTEDIPLLARYFVGECSRRSGRRVKGISSETTECLVHYDWPGNVRELQNTIERAVVLGSTELVLPEDLPDVVLENKLLRKVPVTKFYERVKEIKKRLVLEAMESAKGDYTEAARSLGMHRNNLHRLIRELGLKDVLKK
jgi:transcriptional regulator with GAF, ATPase, and Fis domain